MIFTARINSDLVFLLLIKLLPVVPVVNRVLENLSPQSCDDLAVSPNGSDESGSF